MILQSVTGTVYPHPMHVLCILILCVWCVASSYVCGVYPHPMCVTGFSPGLRTRPAAGA